MQLEMFSQVLGLRKHFFTVWARDLLSLVDPFDVRFQVTNHTESVPTMLTCECFFGRVGLFMALQELCSPECHFASVTLVTSLSFCMDLLVIRQVRLGLKCHLADVARERSDIEVDIQMRTQLT